MKKANYVSKVVFETIVLFLTWILLTESFATSELIFGFLIALVISIGTADLFTEHGLAHLNPKRLFYLIIYIPYYLYQVIKANIQVAVIVLSPSLPIKPGIVKVKTNLKSDVGKLSLANSITLTPGTITMDVQDDELFVHWIKVEDESVEGATESIVSPFEKFLKEIFS
ncbi:Na+/H+ antiporter subunit E [Caldisericum exile]|uniref:Na(+)/H(+) antiporter subunit E n=1 Tax=Caldisericum exile (strain DSM 21853 / NBRC 104410 / AZM16c01) TaxID=511051 RepID=A0A7U6GDU9_CALEA|nr:Na+/H+ antiporter subunit E [Caldisericum exile]BAL80530.1 Na(+)/H(+) antiporter subunit E [Caldisericum exile AZM16c01]